jgi:hypothetical protein
MKGKREGKLTEPMPLIDHKTGIVHLPNDRTISPDLTLEAFEADPAFAEGRTVTSGVPWWSYAIPEGRIDGKELLASVHFYDHTLLSVELAVNHYAPEQKSVSVKVEADAKDFHDRLLVQTLGPSTGTIVTPSSSPDRHPILDRFPEWSYPWGTVSSIFIGQSCSSIILVRYGNRWDEAHRLDKERRKKP